MIYCFDIDNTILKTEGTDYYSSKPDIEVVKNINKLHDDGHTIIIATARGALTGKDWTDYTREQLLTFGVKFDKLIFKPYADYYIGDEAINIKDWMKHE